ncbi:MAG: guanylate kinase [Rhodospirillaceae bacterium]|nr:guanylate kinase [Rhodospirillaceae bacterium]MDG1273330.1 guanylate kinase [Alphaproteobacteria bacterium]MDG1888648.1 guanylate kinase [Alphaproteobacteria bacterium]|tara:strand:+ start:314 stop:952 length:639 start_codon:yes stop_codon:yes gene_type:complete
MTLASIKRRGLMLVLSSPSGAGKTSIARELLALDENLQMSISATTRPRRPGEVHGVDYEFIQPNTFREMIDDEKLLEYAKVFDYYYGTPRYPVEKALASGKDVLFDIDWQGTQQLAEHVGSDLIRVFILPPSTRDLERRLRTRAQDSVSVVDNRMAKAMDEISHYPEYDYIVVNTVLKESVRNVRSILTSERLKRQRQIGLTDFIKRLREGS